MISPPKPPNPSQFSSPASNGSPWAFYGGNSGSPNTNQFAHGPMPQAQYQASQSNPYSLYGGGSSMGGLFGAQNPTQAPSAGPGMHITGSYNLPQSSYMPYPSQSQNQQLTNNQVSGNLAGGDIRNLAKAYLPSSDSGVSTDFRNEPGMMANLLGPRSQIASQNELTMATNPYAFDNSNFNALMSLFGQQGNEAFNLGQIGQNMYQTGQAANLDNLGSALGLFGNLFGGLTGAMGNLTNGLMGSADSMLGGFDPTSMLGAGGGQMPTYSPVGTSGPLSLGSPLGNGSALGDPSSLFGSF